MLVSDKILFGQRFFPPLDKYSNSAVPAFTAQNRCGHWWFGLLSCAQISIVQDGKWYLTAKSLAFFLFGTANPWGFCEKSRIKTDEFCRTLAMERMPSLALVLNPESSSLVLWYCWQALLQLERWLILLLFLVLSYIESQSACIILPPTSGKLPFWNILSNSKIPSPRRQDNSANGNNLLSFILLISSV